MREMPWSQEAEESLLGGLLVDDQLMPDVILEVAPEDFYMARHRHLFDAMRRLEAKRKPIDHALLVDELKQVDTDDWGGIAYLGQLMRNTAGTRHLIHYATKVKDLAMERRLIGAHHNASEVMDDSELTVTQKAERMSSEILQAVEARAAQEVLGVKDMAREWLKELDDLSKLGGGLSGLSTGFYELDKACRGLHAGELILIGAGPATGKTHFACNIANHVAGQGKSVYFASMEMSRMELMHRLCAARTGASYEAILQADFERARDHIQSFMTEMLNWRLIIDDAGMQTVGKLRAKLKRVQRKQGLDLVIIDYLGLMNADTKSKGRYEEISEISRGLKVLAQELKVPVIALAQLNRKNTERQDKRPQLTDLRDSGSLEQDANVVLFLYRHVIFDEKCKNPDIAELIISKLRHGKTGVIPLITNFSSCQFLNVDRTYLADDWRDHSKHETGGYQL